MTREVRIKGTPISKGVGIGTTVFLEMDDSDVPEFPITMGEVDEEIARYHTARTSSRDALRSLQEDLSSVGSSVVASIIGVHIEMLDDPLMTTEMEKKIRETLKNSESVFHNVIHDYETKFSEMNDGFFKQRLSDVKDLSQRVLRNLCGEPKTAFEQIPQAAILVAKELSPSDIALIDASKIGAFVTETGGSTSHAALIARAKGIPYVAGIDRTAFTYGVDTQIIVDGDRKSVV